MMKDDTAGLLCGSCSLLASLAVLGEGLLELLDHGRHARPRQLKLLLKLAVAIARLGRRLFVRWSIS